MPTDKNGKNENNNDAMNLTRLFWYLYNNLHFIFFHLDWLLLSYNWMITLIDITFNSVNCNDNLIIVSSSIKSRWYSLFIECEV